MRLTRIAIDGDGVVDLHPRMTLVRGLDDQARQRLVDAIAGLPEGSTRGLSGWVELDGARRELGPEVLEELTAPADAKLVVRAGDLPGSDPALHRVSSRRADLGYERDRLLERLEVAHARVREATEECGRALRDWQVVHGGLPEVDDRGAVVLEPDAPPEPEPVEEQVDPREELLERIEEIDRALLPLDPVEPAPVLAALEATLPSSSSEPVAQDDDVVEPVIEPVAEPVEPVVEEPEPEPEQDPGPPAPSPPPDPFADDGFSVGDAFASPLEGTGFDDDPDPVVFAGRLRVAEARRALAAVQAAQRSSLARSELLEALEAAHAEVVDAHHRDRFGRGRQKVDEARATEQQLLDQLGFPSYTAYVLALGTIREGDEPEGLTDAHEAVEAAEAHLARIVAERSLPGGRHGGDDDESTVPEVVPSATTELRAALVEVGLVLEDVATDEVTLVALARSWLGEQETALARRDALLLERAELEERLAELPDPDQAEEPLSEVAALARAEAELLGAEAEVSGVTTRLEEIAEEIKEAIAEEEAEEAEQPEVEPEVTMEQRVDDVTWFLTTRLAALRSAEDVTLPIVLDDPFVDFDPPHATELLGSVEAFGGAVQVILLTEDPALVAWTEGLGTERAWVVDAAR